METFNWQCIEQFHQKKILVIGDFIIDEFIHGDSTRLSPEAPVPVVDVRSKRLVLGGAANVAANLKALGAKVFFCSITGDDADGDAGFALVNSAGVSSDGVIRERHRATMVKTRVIADGHPLVRLDRGSDSVISSRSEQSLMRYVEQFFAICDGIVIADYHKGVVTPGLIAHIQQLNRENPKFIAVDSKRLTLFRGLAPSLVKPNYEEALKLLGYERESGDRRAQLKRCGKLIFDKTNARWVVLTLDKDGSLWFENGKLLLEMDAPAVSVPHVCGAGDTFISASTLALVSRDDASGAARIATTAALIAIEKVHTSLCSRLELLARLEQDQKLIVSTKRLREIVAYHRELGHRIVFTNGCFDILHSGHVNYLGLAKQLGDVLIVGVNSDESITRLKGADRPINSLSDRLSVLAGLGCVDHVVVFGDRSDDTPVALIREIAPDVFAKGGDYQDKALPEAALVEALGGQVQLIPLTADRSTTSLIRKIYAQTRINEVAN